MAQRRQQDRKKEYLNSPKPGYKRVVPDGGWGWIVAIGASMINLLYTAGCLTFGLIYTDLVTKLETSGSVAGWVIGLYYFMSNALGPLVLSFAVKHTYRLAAIIGAGLAFIGFFSSAFVNSIHILFLTFGIIAGTGTSFAMSTSLCVVYPYFNKHKGKATSIALTGFPIGRFIMAPLLQYVHLEFGFKGLLLIVSAMMLNICVCGLLFHPVSEHMKLVKDDLHDAESVEENEEKAENETLEKSEPEELDKFIETNQHKGSLSSLSLQDKRSHAPEMSSTLAVNLEDLEIESKGNCFQRIYEILFGGISFSILKNPVFYINVQNAFLNISLVTYVFIFLVPLGETKGLTPREIASVMIATSIGETVGRIVLPAIMDYNFVPGRYVIVVTSAITATLLWAVVVANTYPLIIVVCGLLGFFSGGHVGGSFVVGVEVLGVELWPSASGLSQFFQAFFLLGFGPVIGWANDITGGFDVLYLTVSGVAYLSTLAWLLLPLAQKCQSKSKSEDPA